MAVFACEACGLGVGTLSPANSASLFDPRCTACGGALELVDEQQYAGIAHESAGECLLNGSTSEVAGIEPCSPLQFSAARHA